MAQRQRTGRARRASRICTTGAPTWTSPAADRLRVALDHVSGMTGGNFLEHVVQELGKVLGFKYVYVGELVDNPCRISSIASSINGGPGEPLTYALEGTPCAKVMMQEPCIHPSGAYLDYPDAPLMQQNRIECYAGTRLVSAVGKSLGILVAMDDRPRTDAEAEFALSAISLFGSRASAEVDRLHYEQALLAAREIAEKASRAKDQFVAMLSHELRTPLTPVVARLSAMIETGETPESLIGPLREMLRSLELETLLIDELLDFAAITSERVPIVQAPVDVHRILERSLDVMRDMLRESGVELEVHLDATRAWVQGDASRLQHVFVSVLRNAARHAANSKLIIRTTSKSRRVLLQFIDHGEGMSPDQLARLFQPFERGVRGGTLGLGLTIARTLMERHGGSITARSEGPGAGATFEVTLPSLASTPADTEEIGAPGPLRIVLVEDHPPTRSVLASLLRRAGHQVVTADSVADARERLSERPDLLISDIGLPDGTGLDVGRSAIDRWPGLHCIALSGYGAADDIHRSLHAGFRDHIVKPVTLQRLLQAIEQAAPPAS